MYTTTTTHTHAHQHTHKHKHAHTNAHAHARTHTKAQKSSVKLIIEKDASLFTYPDSPYRGYEKGHMKVSE
jgi:hypothetical protein